MSEASKCDRCGSLHSGSPDTALAMGDGIPRDRRGGFGFEEQDVYQGQIQWEELLDLCPGCRADLQEWLEQGDSDV